MWSVLNSKKPENLNTVNFTTERDLADIVLKVSANWEVNGMSGKSQPGNCMLENTLLTVSGRSVWEFRVLKTDKCIKSSYFAITF